MHADGEQESHAHELALCRRWFDLPRVPVRLPRLPESPYDRLVMTVQRPEGFTDEEVSMLADWLGRAPFQSAEDAAALKGGAGAAPMPSRPFEVTPAPWEDEGADPFRETAP